MLAPANLIGRTVSFLLLPSWRVRSTLILGPRAAIPLLALFPEAGGGGGGDDDDAIKNSILFIIALAGRRFFAVNVARAARFPPFISLGFRFLLE